MPVRAVTPRVPALHGHTYVHRFDCAGDCCNFDADQDERAVGDPYDFEWPDAPLGRRTRFVEEDHAGRAGQSSGSLRVMPAAPLSAGPDGRGGCPSTSRSSAREGSRAGTSSENHQAAAPLDERTPTPRDGHSSPSRGHGDPEEVARPVWSPDAP